MTLDLKPRFVSAGEIADGNREKVEHIFHELEDVLRELKKLCVSQDSNTVRTNYEIGRTIDHEYDRFRTADDRCKNIFQVNFYEEVGEILGIHSRTLRDCRRFALMYDQQQFEELLSCGVNWSHVRQLITLKSEQERQQLAQRIGNEGLTATELTKIVAGHRKFEQEAKNKNLKGKQAKPPANVKAAIGNLNELSRTFHVRALDLLFGDKYDLPSEIGSEPPDDLTTEQRDEVAHAADQLELVASKAKESASRLREVLPRYDRVFEERKKRKDPKSTESDSTAGRNRRRHQYVSPAGKE